MENSIDSATSRDGTTCTLSRVMDWNDREITVPDGGDCRDGREVPSIRYAHWRQALSCAFAQDAPHTITCAVTGDGRHFTIDRL
jgi:hypothetical protein